MPFVPDPSQNTPAGSLIPYIYNPKPGDPPNQPSYFNDIQYLEPPLDGQNPYNIPDIPEE